MNEQTTEVEQAVERLRRVDSHETRELVYGNRPEYQEGEPQHLNWEWQFEQYVTDLGTVADAYLRETDTRPITEEWARSVATSSVVRFGGDTADFEIDSRCDLKNLRNRKQWVISTPVSRAIITTIGQFYKACDLFGVKLNGE